MLWIADVMNGDNSSPTLSPKAVFVSYVCNRTYAFEPKTGVSLWSDGTCEGGGGTTSVFFDGRLYVHDIGGAGLVLDAATGGQLSTFGSRMIPAFKGDVGFFTKAISSTPFGVSLSATSLATGMSSWTFTGDGTLTTPPLVVGDRVFIGSSQGTLFAVDVATGKSSWSATVGAAIPIANEVGLSVALPGLAAGSGVLVVPTQTGLVAFGP
jgi:outer membrane protein assembly factor BamB